MSEVWKIIPEFENYMVSNLGNVRSKRKLLNPTTNLHGYKVVSLHNKGVKKQKKVHQLVALCFLNYQFENHSLVIDHVNGVKTDNKVENLQLITQRQNKSKDSPKITCSKTGVYLQKKTGRFTAMIYIKNTYKYLGSFKTEEEASDYYQKALKEFSETGIVNVFKKPNFYSNSKGVSYCKRTNVWVANSKKIYLGRFKTESDAINAVKTFNKF
jgi:hypothetical protein